MENKHINRRQTLKNIAVLSSAALFSPYLTLGKPDAPFKIVIKNGKVFTDNTLKQVFVGITSDNKIKLSGKPIEGQKEIDATGKIISPGFIDILADNAGNPKKTYKIFEKYKLADGATTVLQMHGGAADVAQYYKYFGAIPHYVNYGVGVFVMVIRNRTPSLSTRLKLTEKGLEEGGLGVCHSIEYQPTPYSELLQYAKLAKKYGRPLFLHLRYSSESKELEGVKEAIKLSQATGARVHIDHLHSTGGTYNMSKALDLIQSANNLGARITTCVYPYSFWATYLISKRFDKGWQDRFKITYKDLTIVGTGEKLTASTFNIYRKRYGILVATPPGIMPFEKTVNLALQTDFCMIGSDGGIESEPRANNHPRGAGCFATTIRHGMNIGMSLEKVLSKITTLPRKLMRSSLDDRGVIADGKVADLTIFDPKTINGKATVANPNQFSAGISSVILNGDIVYQNKKLLALKGKGIKY